MSVSRSALESSAARLAEVLVGAQQAGDRAGHDGQALDAVAQGAELVVIDHRAELDDPRVRPA